MQTKAPTDYHRCCFDFQRHLKLPKAAVSDEYACCYLFTGHLSIALYLLVFHAFYGHGM